MKIQLTTENKATSNQAYLIDTEHAVQYLPKSAQVFDLNELKAGQTRYIAQSKSTILLHHLGEESKINIEKIRKGIYALVVMANDLGFSQLTIAVQENFNQLGWEELVSTIAETCILSNYQFNLYLSKPKVNSLEQIFIQVEKSTPALKKAVDEGVILAESTCIARDLVNEPVITLNAVEMAKRTQEFGKSYGFKVEVLDKKKIESLKMGGLLAVNYGSELPPTFSILEYKGAKAKNKQPIVLVGKGVVYDTGGLSLKPTEGGMDTMKCDMAGAAAVIGAFCAISRLKLPIHVVGLIPATDNRPGKNAYTPGDIIQMHSGAYVEVLNTDAEGRLILADALHFAKQYNPELVIDLATLTGAAVVAVGDIGIAMMSTADENTKAEIKQAGLEVYERLVELPLWEEYFELLRSPIADMKNIGGRYAGSITAAKFLEYFTDYPWIHLDIAGPAFLNAPQGYRSRGGTGVGVRLLTKFLKNKIK